MESKRQGHTLKMWSRLQVRMTISHVCAAVVTALLLELLIFAFLFTVVAHSPFVGQSTTDAARRTAQAYALEAALQAGGDTLDPHSTFQPGQPSSLVLPEAGATEQVSYNKSRSPTPQPVALLITPNGSVLASSYPARYPVAPPDTYLKAGQMGLIRTALAGKAGSIVEATAQGNVASVAEPIWSKHKRLLGAIYIQMAPVVAFNGNIFSLAGAMLVTALFFIIIMAPAGALFGMLATRGLVRRIHHLVLTTARFANGDYTQRVPVTRQDEIGQLESQFNSMAQQLVESIARQQKLVEQHARQEERARIEQELRTARLIQRSLLPKEQPTLPGWQIATYYQAAREVGGDLYDFLTFDDGRLGLVIGDVSGKGMPAALMMASTRSMLRAAAQVTASPGEVLARVNDLLYVDMPAMMFVTCFYAILDPAQGKLHYANAGHDLPYHCQGGTVSELRATGMPLGLMPGMYYEEQEVVIAHDENLLFYTDGLVEAHNASREMFGFPRLQSLLMESSAGATLIDFLLNELRCFTGEGWEQEDDLTLLILQRAMNTEAQAHSVLEQPPASGERSSS